MTTILAVTTRDEAAPGAALARHLIALEASGGAVADVFEDPCGIVLAAGAHGVEPREATLVGTPSCVVAADARLFHQDDLRRALRRAAVPVTAPGAAGLIAAAYEAWGTRCLERLEGEFAFVLWDRRVRRLVAARDLTGRRPLFVAEGRGHVLVGSGIASLVAHPAIDQTLNLPVIGAEAAGLLFASGNETCYRAVRRIGGGEMLTCADGRAPVVERWWTPRREADLATLGFDDAAEALREALVVAAGERCDPSSATAVWMSGGRDSTAAFAAAAESRRRAGRAAPIVPLTRRYPAGDSGNEDRFVEAVGAHWGVTPRWVETAPVRMMADAEWRAARRAEPFAQPFESLTRALAQATHDAGCRLALDGHGGDFLFQVSPIYLADLVRHGRVRGALRDWRSMSAAGLRGWRDAVSWALVPLLPSWARATVGVLRGRPLSVPREGSPPAWLDPRFVAASALDERVRAGALPRGGSSLADAEVEWYLTHPFFGRVNAMMGRVALEYGIELRSPLFDHRVVALALSRPREERNLAGDKKRLLRHAMRGLLPDAVLAPRGGKTGTQRSFFFRGMRDEVLPRLETLCRDSMLAELGIVVPGALEAAVAAHRSGRTTVNLDALYTTLQAELWLRARSGRPDDLVPRPAAPAGPRPEPVEVAHAIA